MSRVVKIIGFIGAAFLILVGTFVPLISVVSLADGETDVRLYVFIIIGLTMLLSGLWILHRMTRRSVERTHSESLEDESW